MDTREKLIEILKRIDAYGDACITGIKALADLLVENGVTVQQWVPVAERRPDGECIATCMLPGEYGYKEMLVGWIGQAADSKTGYVCESDDVILLNVTHWMQPEFPAAAEKGEQ